MVEVFTKKERTIMVELYHPLHNNHLCLSDTGITNLKSDEPFDILVSNFGEHAIDFLPHQVVAYASGYSDTLVESEISYAEMFCIIPNDVETKFCKRHVDAKDIDTINRQIADQREVRMGKDEKPLSADDISIDIPPDIDDAIQPML